MASQLREFEGPEAPVKSHHAAVDGRGLRRQQEAQARQHLVRAKAAPGGHGTGHLPVAGKEFVPAPGIQPAQTDGTGAEAASGQLHAEAAVQALTGQLGRGVPALPGRRPLRGTGRNEDTTAETAGQHGPAHGTQAAGPQGDVIIRPAFYGTGRRQGHQLFEAGMQQIRQMPHRPAQQGFAAGGQGLGIGKDEGGQAVLRAAGAAGVVTADTADLRPFGAQGQCQGTAKIAAAAKDEDGTMERQSHGRIVKKKRSGRKGPAACGLRQPVGRPG